MEVKSLIQGHKTRLGWRQDSNQDSPIPNPHSQLFLHNTEQQPRGRGDMEPGRQRWTQEKFMEGRLGSEPEQHRGYPRDR